MSSVHPTAVISPTAQVGVNFTAGPYAIVEPGAVLGDNCTLGSHAVVKSGVSLGSSNTLHEGAVLGGTPQHLGAGDQLGRLRIGDGNTFREHVTVHRGCSPSGDTVVGDRNMVMVNAHIAHDCRIGNHTIIANNVMLAGHVELGDRVYAAGAVGVHQFCRIGRNVMLGGAARLKRDVPPFLMLDGDSTAVAGLNLVGLRRAGFSSEEIRQLKQAYRIIYRSQLAWDQVIETLETQFRSGPASEFAPFLRDSQRGIAQARVQTTRQAHGDSAAAASRGSQSGEERGGEERGEEDSAVTIRFPGRHAA